MTIRAPGPPTNHRGRCGVAPAKRLSTAAALISLGLTAAAAVSCGGKQQRPGPITAAAKASTRAPDQVGWLVINVEEPPTDDLMKVKPADLPSHVRSLYRLKPDRRILYAAAELKRLVGGGPRAGTISLRFDSGRWRVFLDHEPLGELPELPGFTDAKTFLALLVGPTPPAGSSTPAAPLEERNRVALEQGPPTEVLSTLATLNHAWTKSPRDPAVLKAALKGYLWLGLLTADQLNLADPLLGKALALFVLAESYAPGQFAREECLLATLLDYEDHATAVGATLPADDPVRLFAMRDLTGLAAAAHKGYPRVQYLYLFWLAVQDVDEDVWFQRLEESGWGHQVDFVSLRLALKLAPFNWRTTFSFLTESRLLDEFSQPQRAETPPTENAHLLWRSAAWKEAERLYAARRPPPESRLKEFEAAVDREAARLDGPLLDRYVVRAHYLANFYNAIYKAASYDFDQLSSMDAAEAYAKTFIDPPSGTASELRDWIRDLIEAKRSSEALRRVAADLPGLGHIGVMSLNSILLALQTSASRGGWDPIIRREVRSYFGRLDSRPSNLLLASRAALYSLYDFSLAERLLRKSTSTSPKGAGWQVTWGLRFLGDQAGLEALAADRQRPSTVRAAALSELRRLPKHDVPWRLARYRELISEDVDSSTALTYAVGLLKEQKDFRGARLLIDGWLDRRSKEDLQRAHVIVMKAQVLREEGRFQEAYRVVEPVIETWAWDCLDMGATLLADLGRLDDAHQLANAMLERYGGGASAARVARILWLKSQDDEAARVLTAPDRHLDRGAWMYNVAPAFVDAFTKAPDTRAEAAFRELTNRNVAVLELLPFPEEMEKAGRPELAFKMCEILGRKGPAGWVKSVGYKALAKARGASAARDWLRKNTTPAEQDILAKQAFQDKDFDLLWDLPDHPDRFKDEILKMRRAAALRYERTPNEERKTSLIAYSESRQKDEPAVYGLFLLGRIDRQHLFATIQNTYSLCGAAWLLGTAAAADGLYDEANGWFQVCLETGVDIPPASFTQATLKRWGEDGETLAEIARKKVY